jgi:hypothetical protein
MKSRKERTLLPFGECPQLGDASLSKGLGDRGTPRNVLCFFLPLLKKLFPFNNKIIEMIAHDFPPSN